MKKTFFGLFLLLAGSLAFVQAYLPRMVDTKLVGLMLDNIEQLITAKGERVAEIAVETLYDRLDWELDARKRYIMGEVIDRLSIEYDLEIKKKDIVRDDEQKDPDQDIKDKGVVVDTPSTPVVGGKHQLGDVTYVAPIEPKPTTMNVTTYWTTIGGDCATLTQEIHEVPRAPAYLQTTLAVLLQGPTGDQALVSAGLSDDDMSGYLQSVSLVDGIAFVDFKSGFLDTLNTCEGASSQPVQLLNATILGVKGVNNVVYALEGNVSEFYLGLDVVSGLDLSLDELQVAFDTKKLVTPTQIVLASRGRRLYSSAYGVYENTLEEGELTSYRVCGHGHKQCLTVIERDSDHRVEKTGCDVVHYRMDRAACGDEYVTMIDGRQLVVSGLGGWDTYAFNEFMSSIAVK